MSVVDGMLMDRRTAGRSRPTRGVGIEPGRGDRGRDAMRYSAGGDRSTAPHPAGDSPSTPADHFASVASSSSTTPTTPTRPEPPRPSTCCARSPGEGRRVVVTPGMVELGARQFDENSRFAEGRRRARASDLRGGGSDQSTGAGGRSRWRCARRLPFCPHDRKRWNGSARGWDRAMPCSTRTICPTITRDPRFARDLAGPRR